jgi:hypothetical protein
VTDETQPGVEVDAELWAEFRAEVEARRGGVRGHLRNELETALREYIAGGQATGDQINARLQRIEDAVGVAGTDGGADLRDAEMRARAEDDTEETGTKKPAKTAPRGDKLSDLIGRLRERETGAPDKEIQATLPEANIAEVVTEEYGFTEDTTAEYVEQIRERLGLVEHPDIDDLLCTPERREELVNESASDRLEEL